jgi:hypothetical protein
MVSLQLELKIVDDQIKFHGEYQSRREFYVDVFNVLNHGLLCCIKIVIKITNGLTAVGGSV